MRLLCLLLLPCLAFADDTVDLQLKQVHLNELYSVVYGDMLKRNYTLDKDVLDLPDTISIDWHQLKPADAEKALNQLTLDHGLTIEKSGAIYTIKKQVKTDNNQTEPLIYKPRFRSVAYLTQLVRSVYPDVPTISTAPIQQKDQTTQQTQAAPSPTSAAALVDRTDYDQVALLVPSANVYKIQSLLEALDIPQGEILLKAAVFEVGTGKQQGSAINLAVNILNKKAGLSISSQLPQGVSASFSALGIDAVIAAFDNQDNFKLVSNPQVRVLSGKSASFNVGSSVPVLSGFQLDKNGNPVQSVEYKPSGVILTVSPNVHTDLIELKVDQELSSFVQTTTGVNSTPTLLTRSVNTFLSMKPNETVLIAGLKQDSQTYNERRLPFLGWLLGNSSEKSNSEVLIFLELQRL